MISPISSAHPSDVHEASKPPAPKPEPQAQTPKSGALSSDQVTLKSAGQVEHDADSK
jgi:hypothetical protein